MKLFQVDSFTSEPFKGNPAGVCITDEVLPVAVMQNIASEMALSETAFIVKHSEAEFSIRFFTPTTEVPLCGHATLASAHILWEQGFVSKSSAEIKFKAIENTLFAELLENNSICLTFPVLKGELDDSWKNKILNTKIPALLPEEVVACWTVFNQQNKVIKLIIELKTDQLVREFQANFEAIKQLPLQDGIVITAKSSNENYDIISRYFAPLIGIPEDPVTGFAHCALAKYWESKIGPTLRAYQASARGGNLTVELVADTVKLTGTAITLYELVPQI